MTTTASPSPPWVLKKAILVHAPDLGISCSAHLRIAHNQTANQGSISLRITADLANLSGRSQMLTLTIPPEIIEKCALAPRSNDTLCSPHLVSLLRASVTNVSAVSTLSLKLGTTAILLCPSGAETLSPANPRDSNFDAFAKICRCEFLRLHFSRRQFVNKELDQLEAFSHVLRNRSLQAESFDHARHGVVERDWRVFNLSLNPPPYCEQPAFGQVKLVDPPLYSENSIPEQVLGKRRAPSIPSDNERRKIPPFPSPQPPDSPTEINTPSILSPSPPPIRPTHFTRATSPSRKQREILARLEAEMRGLSDDMICNLLIQSGHQHLLASPAGRDTDVPSGSEKISCAEVDAVERRLKQYIDQTIERRLKSHVDEIVDIAASECRDHIFDECKTNEAEFREQVDDAKSEIRITANECMKEMKEQAQLHMNDIEDHGVEVEMYAKEEATKLKRWFHASAQSSLDRNAYSSHEPDARRSSV